jgi:cytochrome c oxidase subunit 3
LPESAHASAAAGQAHAHHGAALRHHFATAEQQKESAVLGMWVFIAQEILFFGGLFGAYLVYRSLYPYAFADAAGHLDWQLGAFNTVVLIGSSFTMAMAVHSAAHGQRKAIVAWLVATILLGSVFLGVKVVEYGDKFEHHLVPGARFQYTPHHEANLQHDPDLAKHAQIYFSLYFMMTGLHALHMIIGIPILAWIGWRAWSGEFGPHYDSPVEIVGLYWHFVDIVWIFLFPLLYLIGAH